MYPQRIPVKTIYQRIPAYPSQDYIPQPYIFEASSGASEELGVDLFVAVSSNFWACVDSKLLHDAKLEEDMCTGML